jgi:hypothetical protein
MLLWAVCSIAPIGRVILVLMKNEIPTIIPPASFFLLVFLMCYICFNGFLLSLGMDFAKKIGLRFLFLDENTDWYKDFLRPIIIISIAYSCFLPAFHIVRLILFSSIVDHIWSWNVIFYKGIEEAFDAIGDASVGVLVIFSGVALFIKKIAKNVSMSVIVPLAIIFIVIVPNVMEYMWHFRVGTPFAFDIDKFISYVNVVFLFTIAWLKGFEVAVSWYVLITIVFSLIRPAVFIAFGF